jgi:hypothetical protein
LVAKKLTIRVYFPSTTAFRRSYDHTSGASPTCQYMFCHSPDSRTTSKKTAKILPTASLDAEEVCHGEQDVKSCDDVGRKKATERSVGIL